MDWLRLLPRAYAAFTRPKRPSRSRPAWSGDAPIRFGVLGAARISPMALYYPAIRAGDDRVIVDAVAARDTKRAEAHAKEHKILRTLSSYDDIINDDSIDAVYIPLPNSHHCEWAIKALEAGKHVLCEKPLTANAEEAVRLEQAAVAAAEKGVVFMEAFHWKYHPASQRALEIARSEEIGEVTHVHTTMFIPQMFLKVDDIRFNLALAGGSQMDCAYVIHGARSFSGMEPEVVGATPKRGVGAQADVDLRMTTDLKFPNGATGKMECALREASGNSVSNRVILKGRNGSLEYDGFILPTLKHHIKVFDANGKLKRTERKYARAGHEEDSTYYHQMMAFLKCIEQTKGGEKPTVMTDATDGVRTMRVMDSIYKAAGMSVRKGTIA